MVDCSVVSGVSDCNNRAYNLVIKRGHAYPICNFHKKKLSGDDNE